VPSAASAAGYQPSVSVPPPAPYLLNNAPGAAARAQATALRDAAPVRTFLGRLVDLSTSERAWRLGADGEELVAAKLARLGQRDPRWRVLHAIPVGTRGADIDHLVLGPGGVYSLNAKHHPDATIWVGGDAFLVNGQRHPYVRNSRHEAHRASRLLTAASGVQTHVTGVIVPVRARGVTVKTMPADVSVVPRQQIAAWLRRQPRRLDDRTIAVLFEAARRLSTWQPPGPDVSG
jgi:nuclease-like protein